TPGQRVVRDFRVRGAAEQDRRAPGPDGRAGAVVPERVAGDLRPAGNLELDAAAGVVVDAIIGDGVVGAMDVAPDRDAGVRARDLVAVDGDRREGDLGAARLPATVEAVDSVIVQRVALDERAAQARAVDGFFAAIAEIVADYLQVGTVVERQVRTVR